MGAWALHPWNVGFLWRAPQGPFRRITDAQAQQFDRDGYIVVDDVLDADMLESVRDEIDGFEARGDEWLRTQPEGRFTIAEAGAITFTVHLVTRSPRLRAVAHAPALVDLCADLVGPDVNLYWDQAVYKKPEKPRRFPWHQDNGYTFIEPQQYLTAWIALTDADERNGCPWVAPGLHRLGTLAHTYVEPLGYECFSAPPSSVAAPVRAGSAVVFSSLTPHLTGPNTTEQTRKAYIVQYAPAGAVTRTADGPRSCDEPDRQFPVLRDGRAVHA